MSRMWATGLLLVLAVGLMVFVFFLENPSFHVLANKMESQPVVAQGECDREYSCASCSQVRICRRTPGGSGGLQEVFKLSCSGTTPFCDPLRGACSATPSHECADLGAFPCMQDGVFADPTDCKTYHVCENGTSHTFHCESGMYFDGTKCGTSSCYTIDCSGKSGIKVPHSLNASTYGYCLNGKPLFMDACPPGQMMYADQQQCLTSCPYSGAYVADPSNCTQYYTCSGSGSYYTLTVKRCSVGQRFDPSTNYCRTTTSVSCVPSRGSTSPLVFNLQVN